VILESLRQHKALASEKDRTTALAAAQQRARELGLDVDLPVEDTDGLLAGPAS